MKGDFLAMIDDFEFLRKKYKKDKDEYSVARVDGVLEGIRLSMAVVDKHTNEFSKVN